MLDVNSESFETQVSTLDYNGVTFYFCDGDLTEPGNGRQTATISFAEYPELFVEKYMNVPEAYMVRLPLDHSYFTDLDGYYHYEDLFAYDFQLYYVKTEDGNHYIYLFCEESEGEY